MKLRFSLPVYLLCAVLAVGLAGYALSNAHARSGEVQRARLEEALHRAAAACYAIEGAYPPDVDYLRQHYGIRYDRNRFAVIYQPVASNLMPDMTVLERKP